MNQKLVCLLLGLAVASAANNPITILFDIFRHDPVPSQASVDGEIDNVLVSVRDLKKSNDLYKNFHPFHLPDTTVSPMTLTEIKLYGLENIYRHGEAVVDYKDELAIVTVQIGAPNVTALTEYTMLGTHGKVTAKIENPVFAIYIHLDRNTFKIDVKNFEITNIGLIDINLEGDSFTASLLASTVKIGVKAKSKSVVSMLFKQLIEGLIQDHNNSI